MLWGAYVLRGGWIVKLTTYLGRKLVEPVTPETEMFFGLQVDVMRLYVHPMGKETDADRRRREWAEGVTSLGFRTHS